MDTHSSLSYFPPPPILRHTHAYTLDAWLTGLPSWSSLTFTVCQYENREDEGLQLENRAPFTPHTLAQTHTHTQLSNLLMILHRSDLHFSGQHPFTFQEARPRREASAAKLDKQMLATKCESLPKLFAGNSAWCASLTLPGEGQRQSLHQFLCRS